MNHFLVHDDVLLQSTVTGKAGQHALQTLQTVIRNKIFPKLTSCWLLQGSYLASNETCPWRVVQRTQKKKQRHLIFVSPPPFFHIRTCRHIHTYMRSLVHTPLAINFVLNCFPLLSLRLLLLPSTMVYAPFYLCTYLHNICCCCCSQVQKWWMPPSMYIPTQYLLCALGASLLLIVV